MMSVRRSERRLGECIGKTATWPELCAENQLFGNTESGAVCVSSS